MIKHSTPSTISIIKKTSVLVVTLILSSVTFAGELKFRYRDRPQMCDDAEYVRRLGDSFRRAHHEYGIKPRSLRSNDHSDPYDLEYDFNQYKTSDDSNGREIIIDRDAINFQISRAEQFDYIRKEKKRAKKSDVCFKSILSQLPPATTKNARIDQLNEIMYKAIRLEMDSVLRSSLSLGANPNYLFAPGKKRILDEAYRASTIQILLEHGADPKLCNSSPIIRLFSYYFDRKALDKKHYESSQSYAERVRDDQMRKGDKLYKCLNALIKKGININLTSGDKTIVSKINHLFSKNKLDYDVASYFVAKMIWQGAKAAGMYYNPRSTGARLQQCTLSEQKRYNTTIGFLSCALYENSPIYALPPELRKVIGKLTKQGFRFNYLKKPESEMNIEEIPEAVDVEIVEPALVEAMPIDNVNNSINPQNQAATNQKRSQIAYHAERPQPCQPLLLFPHKAPQKIILACCAAFVIKKCSHYWKRWRRLQKIRKKKNALPSKA